VCLQIQSEASGEGAFFLKIASCHWPDTEAKPSVMRFHSTPESAENLEITKLAIIETVLSIAIYVCSGLYLGTFKYLALAVFFAPLMLFRTKGSAEWGLTVLECGFRRL
jgi:hypothetical protein